MSMNDFLYFDADGTIVAVVDVIHITHAAVATVSHTLMLCLEQMLDVLLFRTFKIVMSVSGLKTEEGWS